MIQGKAHVAELAGLGNQRVYRRAGEYVIDENDPGDELFVILRGRVKVVTMDEDGRELVYAELATGDYFGEMSLDGGRRSASVVTLGPCTLSRVPFPQVRAYLAENPDFAFDLLVTAVKRAREATRLARQLALDDTYGRLRMFLEWHAKAETGDRRVLDRAYTQQEIADRIGCGRERVSRMLARMVELGLILTSGRRPMELLKPLPRRL